MTLLLEASFPRTLDALVARFTAAAQRGARVEAWLFEDAPSRRAAEARLLQNDVIARFRSAYKPLLHALLEEFDTTGLASLTIRTPSHPAGSLERFRLEAFPIAALLPGIDLTFVQGDAPLDYGVQLTWRDGRTEHHAVFAPNVIRNDPMGAAVLGCAGWLRLWPPGAAAPGEDRPLESEYEAAYAAVMQAVAAQDWGTSLPCFETLEIIVTTGGIETRLAHQDECVSTREALHEEFYFSLLEFFQNRFGRPAGDRGLQPGQIVPDILSGPGPTTVRVTAGPPAPMAIAADAGEALAAATAPLAPARIAAELDALGGAACSAVSPQGRPVWGKYFAGAGPGLLISAGQHANETSGVVGALRAAPVLIAQGAHFALIPQENPDGYALHHRLRQANPRHMHHAARYSALGDDLPQRRTPPFHEKAARLEAFRRTEAGLHINLHGYPAHEWTRPLNGYVPRGFAAWTVPKGFFLILRHPPDRAAQARAFIRAVAEAVSTVPGLAAFNAAHLAAYAVHAGPVGAPVHEGIPCFLTPVDDPDVPMTLISEYPDETIYGDAFRLAHEVQMATVLAAAALFRAGLPPI
jgi:hypothetical protein